MAVKWKKLGLKRQTPSCRDRVTGIDSSKVPTEADHKVEQELRLLAADRLQDDKMSDIRCKK